MIHSAAIAPHTLESLEAEHGAARRWTYWTLLAATAATLALLPVAAVDVTVRARGMVRPAVERIELRAQASGRVQRVLARENERVSAGQVLLTLETRDLDERRKRNHQLQDEHRAMHRDLEQLIATFTDGSPPAGGSPELATAVARQDLAQCAAQRRADDLAVVRARSALGRLETLADRGLSSRQELEDAQFEFERLQADAHARIQQTLARWETQVREEDVALAALVSEASRLEEERRLADVCAPASGVLVDCDGWSAGAVLVAGQLLGSVSPDEALVVEAQVSPADIGLVSVGQTVRLQVDAFPYTYWGTLPGEVVAVSGDLAGVGGRAATQPAFKVTVRPGVTRWMARTGARAELRKGLTLTARFVVARRTLWELLRDEARGWVDPESTHPTPRRESL